MQPTSSEVTVPWPVENEALADDRPVSAALPTVPHMACSEKLPASLRPVPVNNAEAQAERVLGLLDDLALVQKGTHFRLAPMSEIAWLQHSSGRIWRGTC